MMRVNEKKRKAIVATKGDDYTRSGCTGSVGKSLH